MADLIALHWGTDEITAVLPGKGKDVRAAALVRPPAGDADSLARWLKSELASKRLGAKKAAIVLPRSAAVFRKLSVPDVSDEELPDLVRMQAATKSPTPLDRLRYDFVPLPKHGEGRDVLLAALPAKTVDDVLVTLHAAGIETVSVGLAPFGTAAQVASGVDSTLIVAVQGQSVEITLVRDRTLLFSHATELQGEGHDEDRQWLLSEITRAVVAADHLAAGGRISRILLLGPAELLGPLATPLATRYEGQAESFDSPAQLGLNVDGDAVSVAALAAAIGQLEPGTLPRLDFLNPRKRIEKPDRRRLQAGLAAAGLLAIVGVGYAMSAMAQGDLDTTITGLKDRSSALDEALKRGEPTLKAERAVSDWLATRADWVEHLGVLNAALPGTDRVYLTTLAFDPASRDTIGRIRATGAARTMYDVRSLKDSLAAKGYLLSPKPDIESRRDPEYPVRFELDLTIPLPKPETTTTKPAGPSPA